MFQVTEGRRELVLLMDAQSFFGQLGGRLEKVWRLISWRLNCLETSQCPGSVMSNLRMPGRLLVSAEPHASLEATVSGQDFLLIEYQYVHFGPYTVLSAPFHFEYERGDLQQTSQQLRLERLLAESIIGHLVPHPATTAITAKC